MAEAADADPTVLIVDDEPQLLEVFSLFLEAEYEVRTANGGEEAIEVVDESIDAALLDRRMPDLRGDEVLREFRKQGYTFPVAMVTAVEPEFDIVELPFDEYVTKPIDGDYLRSVVELLLTRGEYDEESREFFRLASKKAALESSDESGSDLEDREEYAEIVRRMSELESALSETLAQLSEADMEAAYRRL
ncbi:MAG: response regulator [Halodesulfurarchaeum sp.]